MDLPIHEVRLPQDLEPVLLHPLARQEVERVLGGRLLVGDPHAAEELLVRVHGGARVVEAVLVAVGERDPLDAGDGCVAHDLVDPPAVVEVLAEAFGLDEEAGRPQEEERVVDGLVAGLHLVLALDLVEVLDVPAEGAEHGLDERRLGVLLAELPAPAVARDPLAHLGERFPQRRHRSGPPFARLGYHGRGGRVQSGPVLTVP